MYLIRLMRRTSWLRRLIIWSVALIIAAALAGKMSLLFIIGYYAINLLVAVLFMIIQFVALFGFLAQGKSSIILPGDKKTVTLDQYWGQPQLVEVVTSWIHSLKDKEGFWKMGGRPIHGILLSGPPGTGKTYLARAIAGTGGLPFIGMEGSMLRAMFVAVDVIKVAALFSKARTLARLYGGCIVFIDEIDSIGMARGGPATGGQLFGGGMGFLGTSGALTRLLNELDGLGEMREVDVCEDTVRSWFGLPPVDRGVVLFIAATNRPDVLDPALRRAGRLDYHIVVDPPDYMGRKDIIRGYLNQIKHSEVNVEALAHNTSWATPAELKMAIVSGAVRIALARGDDRVSETDIMEALMERYMGIKNPISGIEEDQLYQVAVHEAGHAVALFLLHKDRRVAHLTVNRRGDALGFMLPVLERDLYTMPFSTIVRDIMVSLAGHVATEVVFGEPWTGGGGDFAHVKARLMALARGGYFGWAVREEKVEDKVNNFFESCVEHTRRLMRENKSVVIALAKCLLEERDMSGERVAEVITQAMKDEKGELP